MFEVYFNNRGKRQIVYSLNVQQSINLTFLPLLIMLHTIIYLCIQSITNNKQRELKYHVYHFPNYTNPHQQTITYRHRKWIIKTNCCSYKRSWELSSHTWLNWLTIPWNFDSRTGAGLVARKIFFAYLANTQPFSPGRMSWRRNRERSRMS